MNCLILKGEKAVSGVLEDKQVCVAMFLIVNKGERPHWAGGLARLWICKFVCETAIVSQIRLRNGLDTALTHTLDLQARSNVRWSRVQITPGPPFFVLSWVMFIGLYLLKDSNWNLVFYIYMSNSYSSHLHHIQSPDHLNS